jgi:hypothetical protein
MDELQPTDHAARLHYFLWLKTFSHNISVLNNTVFSDDAWLCEWPKEGADTEF